MVFTVGGCDLVGCADTGCEPSGLSLGFSSVVLLLDDDKSKLRDDRYMWVMEDFSSILLSVVVVVPLFVWGRSDKKGECRLNRGRALVPLLLVVVVVAMVVVEPASLSGTNSLLLVVEESPCTNTCGSKNSSSSSSSSSCATCKTLFCKEDQMRTSHEACRATADTKTVPPPTMAVTVFQDPTDDDKTAAV